MGKIIADCAVGRRSLAVVAAVEVVGALDCNRNKIRWFDECRGNGEEFQIWWILYYELCREQRCKKCK